MREKLLALAAAYRARDYWVSIGDVECFGICYAIRFQLYGFDFHEQGVIRGAVARTPAAPGSLSGYKWPMEDFNSRANWLEALAKEIPDA